MQIKYTGLDPKFFLRAFSDLTGGGADFTLVGAPTSSEITVMQPKFGATTVVKGTGMTFTSSGVFTGGTIDEMSFYRKGADGDTSAEFLDIGWSAVAAFSAIAKASTGDFSELTALLNSEDKLSLQGAASTTAIVSKLVLDPLLSVPFEIRASNFDDRLEGGSGDDFIFARSGDDTVNGGSGADFLDGGRGNDILRGGSATVNGTDSNTILGGGGDDLIKGENGRDFLTGGTGSDTFFGLDGNDVLKGGTGADLIYGGSGRDKIIGGAGADSIYGGLGRDKINGGKHSDEIYGGAKSDKILGGAGGDQLYGGKGVDVITGGTGNDVLYGEGGSDLFVFTASVDEGTDHIMDFTNNRDKINIVGGTATDVSIASSGVGDVDTTITLASGTQIIIDGVDVANIGLDDINFV